MVFMLRAATLAKSCHVRRHRLPDATSEITICGAWHRCPTQRSSLNARRGRRIYGGTIVLLVVNSSQGLEVGYRQGVSIWIQSDTRRAIPDRLPPCTSPDSAVICQLAMRFRGIMRGVEFDKLALRDQRRPPLRSSRHAAFCPLASDCARINRPRKWQPYEAPARARTSAAPAQQPRWVQGSRRGARRGR